MYLNPDQYFKIFKKISVSLKSVNFYKASDDKASDDISICIIMDAFVKRYYHYEKDEKGNDVKVINKISRKNPEHSEAFTCDQDVILAKLQ